MKKTVTIAGAGLVGSLLAVCLRQKGYRVKIFEKRSDPRSAAAKKEAARSINLVITSRGVDALKKVGLRESVFELVVPVYGRTVHALDGALTYQPYGRDKSECNYSVSRGHLNEFLITRAEEAGAEIYFGHKLSKLSLEEKSVSFESNGQIITQNYEVLISAEGAGSVARQALIEQSKTAVQSVIDWLEADYKELLMPAKANGEPALDKNALHIWPRGTHMLMGLPNLDNSFTMTMYLPKKGSWASFENQKTEADIQKLFDQEFSDVEKLLPNFKREFLNNPQGALGTVRCSRWTFKDSMALIGDAAHAIVPFFGQGMNLGFEDCVQLMSALESNHGDWAKAFFDYDSERLPNANAIADMALENFIEMRDKTGQKSFQLRKKVEARIETEFSKIYRSRYGMITYTLIPYAKAQAAGRIQDEILDLLCRNIQSENDVDLKLAERLIREKVAPFFQK